MLILSSSLQAQYGISLGYKRMSASNWENLFNNYNVNNSEVRLASLHEGTAFGIDRWFRLKNYRVEFTPQAMYSRFSRRSADTQDFSFSLVSNFYSLAFHTSFYALDLEGDCDCPTFSKDGNLFSKGFFFQVSPELYYMRNHFQLNEIDAIANHIGFGIGIGAGLDLGLSDFITLTPIIRYSYYPKAKWANLHELLSNSTPPPTDSTKKNTTDMLQVFFGVRMGFRFFD